MADAGMDPQVSRRQRRGAGRLSGALVVALAVTLAGGLLPATGTAAPLPASAPALASTQSSAAVAGRATTYPWVPAALFGMHQHSITVKAPDYRVGSLRLWDSGVAWKRMAPAPGVIDWSGLDAAMANAEAAGVRDVQYVFGHTPLWASSNLQAPGPAGPGTSAPPTDISTFVDFAAAVAARYKGRITSYEMWNEGSLTMYFSGTAEQLAEMTIRGARAIRAVDPDALIVAASSTSGVFRNRPGFWRTYLRALAAAGWPVDAMAIHPYSKSPDYVAGRVAKITRARAFYKANGWTGPLWDTEISFGDRRNLDSTWTQIVYTGQEAAGMLARAYIDAMRLRLGRTYWYGWDSHVLGLDMIDPTTQEVTAAGVAFQTLQGWMVDHQWRGCRVTAKVRWCRMRSATGARSTIVYSTTARKRTVVVPVGVRRLGRLDGSTVAVRAGQKVRVGKVPVLLIGR